MIVRRIVLLTSITPCLALAQLSAQELPAPRQIMKGTVVKAPGSSLNSRSRTQHDNALTRHIAETKKKEQKQNEKSEESSNSQSGLASKTLEQAVKNAAAAVSETGRSTNPLEQEDLKPIPIRRVSILVDASEPEHLFETLATLSGMLQHYKLHPGEVHIHGLTRIPSDAPYDWMRILTRGGKFKSDYKVAEKYGVTGSPSWILETDEGDIVLESFKRIDRFLNQKGEFRRKYLNSTGRSKGEDNEEA